MKPKIILQTKTALWFKKKNRFKLTDYIPTVQKVRNSAYTKFLREMRIVSYEPTYMWIPIAKRRIQMSAK